MRAKEKPHKPYLPVKERKIYEYIFRKGVWIKFLKSGAFTGSTN